MLTETAGAKSVGAARVATTSGIPVCIHCSTTFADETLSIHYFSSKSHPKCKPCNLGFPDPAAYNAHMIYRHGAIPCGKCSLVFGAVGRLQRHYESFPSHGPDTDKQSPASFSQIPKPATSQPPKSKKPTAQASEQRRCNTCNVVFKTRALLEKHNVQKAHWRCESCSTTFVSEKVYQKHMRNKHADSDRPQSRNAIVPPDQPSTTHPEATYPPINLDTGRDDASSSEESDEDPRIARQRRPKVTQQLKDWDDTSTSSHSEGDELVGDALHRFRGMRPTAEVSRGQSTGTPITVKQSRNAWDDSSDSGRDEIQPDQPIRDSTESPEVAELQDSWEDSSTASSESENGEVDSPVADTAMREQTPPTVVRKALSESNVDFLEADAHEVISQPPHPSDSLPPATSTPSPLHPDLGDAGDSDLDAFYDSESLDDESFLDGDHGEGSATDDLGTPRSYERYRCPVCDESYYTLEVLSAHMLANGHGRFGTVESIRDWRVVSASGHIPALSDGSIEPITSQGEVYGASSIPNPAALEPANVALPTPAHGAVNAPDSPPPSTAFHSAGTQPTTPAIFRFPAANPTMYAHAPAPRCMSQCVPCGISFASAGELGLHYRISSRHPSCPMCSKGLENQVALLQHCRAIHRAEMCECGEIVAPSHIRAHYYFSPLHPRCSTCGLGFRDSAELHEHEQTSHTQPGSIFCVNCRWWFGSRRALMEHMPVCFGQAAARPPRLAKTRRFNSVEEYLQEWERTQNVALEIPHFGTVNPQLQAAPPKPRPAPLVVDTNLRPGVAHHAYSATSPSAYHSPILVDHADHVAVASTLPHQTARQVVSVVDAAREKSSSNEDHQSVERPENDSTEAEAGFSVIRNDNTKAGLDSGNGLRSGAFVFMTNSEVYASNSPVHPPSPLAIKQHISHHDKHPPDTPVRVTEASTAPGGFPPYHQSSTSSHTGGASLSSGFTARSVATESTYAQTAASAPTTATTRQDGLSWRCQSCGRDPCDDPTAASCGHIFCFSCIAREILQNMKCPVCNRLFLLKLRPSPAS